MSTDPDELTPGEIGRRLSAVEAALTVLPERIETMLARYVAKEVYDVQHAADAERMGRIEERQTTVEARVSAVEQAPAAVPVAVPHLSPGVIVGLVIAGLALLAPALSSLITLIDKIAN